LAAGEHLGKGNALGNLTLQPWQLIGSLGLGDIAAHAQTPARTAAACCCVQA
jgi:hypothetical protein